MAANMKEFKCPCCGGAIEFNTGSQNLKCPYCLTEFEIDALQAYQEQLADATEDNTEWQKEAGDEWQPGETDGMRVYSCKSCGGEIIADENTAATSCPYCGNPVVMTGQFKGDLRPEWVIPFKKNKEEAKATFRKYLEGKQLLPKVFRDENHIDEIKGVYVPFWLFDADVDAYIRYKATQVRSWSDHDYNYTETSYYSVQRQGTMRFTAIPADGSSRMADDLMESIEPFDLSEAVPFQTAYLAGYLADKYDIPAVEFKSRIESRIRETVTQTLNQTVSGSYATAVPEQSSIQYLSSAAHYALYPVWILNTTWKDQHYIFAMNGQNGKFIGDLPVDEGAYYKNIFLTALIVAVIIFLIAWFVL